MTKRLLIVEDDLELQELYCYMLEGSGLEVEQVQDGVQALARLDQVVPDVVILDLILDEMGGEEVHRQMRRRPALERVPIIVVSVLSAERCRALMSLDGATVLLRKPFGKQALLAAVRAALGGHDE